MELNGRWFLEIVDKDQTWGQFNSGIGIDGQFQFQNWNWNWNCLFEKIIELELNWN